MQTKQQQKDAENIRVKVLAIRKAVKLFILTLVAAVMVNQSSYAYVAKYKEDYFKLYHTHYQYNPDDYMEIFTGLSVQSRQTLQTHTSHTQKSKTNSSGKTTDICFRCTLTLN